MGASTLVEYKDILFAAGASTLEEYALSRVAALENELAALRGSAQKPNDLEVLSCVLPVSRLHPADTSRSYDGAPSAPSLKPIKLVPGAAASSVDQCVHVIF